MFKKKIKAEHTYIIPVQRPKLIPLTMELDKTYELRFIDDSRANIKAVCKYIFSNYVWMEVIAKHRYYEGFSKSELGRCIQYKEVG